MSFDIDWIHSHGAYRERGWWPSLILREAPGPLQMASHSWEAWGAEAERILFVVSVTFPFYGSPNARAQVSQSGWNNM